MVSLGKGLHLLLVLVLNLGVVLREVLLLLLRVFLLRLKFMSPLLSTMASRAVFPLTLGPWHRVQIIVKILGHHLRALVPLWSRVVVHVHFTTIIYNLR